ncbi:MAG: hypothetical protein WKF91_21605 [Segetibacter sp.]
MSKHEFKLNEAGLPTLLQCSVIGCKELLGQMLNKEQKIVNDNARAMFCTRSDVAKTRIKNIEAVLKMIDERPAL